MEISFDFIKEHCETINDVLRFEEMTMGNIYMDELNCKQEDLILARENE